MTPCPAVPDGMRFNEGEGRSASSFPPTAVLAGMAKRSAQIEPDGKDGGADGSATRHRGPDSALIGDVGSALCMRYAPARRSRGSTGCAQRNGSCRPRTTLGAITSSLDRCPNAYTCIAYVTRVIETLIQNNVCGISKRVNTRRKKVLAGCCAEIRRSGGRASRTYGTEAQRLLRRGQIRCGRRGSAVAAPGTHQARSQGLSGRARRAILQSWQT